MTVAALSSNLIEVQRGWKQWALWLEAIGGGTVLFQLDRVHACSDLCLSGSGWIDVVETYKFWGLAILRISPHQILVAEPSNRG